MTSPDWRGEPGDPRGGIEAPIGPVLADRRGLRQQAGLVAVAAIAVAVVGAGIGLGGRGADSPASSTAPSTPRRMHRSRQRARPRVVGAAANRDPGARVPDGDARQSPAFRL